MTIPTLTPHEAADLLQELLKKDLAIEDLKRALLRAKAAHDLAKDELKDAMEARDKLSYEIRNPPPLFGGNGQGKPATEPPIDVNAEVAAGVREAEAAKFGPGDTGGLDFPIDARALPVMPTAKGLPKPATPLGGKKKRARKVKEARA